MEQTQLWMQATPWDEEGSPLIITSRVAPSFECVEFMCEIYTASQKSRVSLAIYGQKYKISKSGSDSIEEDASVIAQDAKSTSEWLSQFANDYQQYLIIGSAIVGGLIALIIIISCCKKMSKSDGYGTLDPEESSLDDSTA